MYRPVSILVPVAGLVAAAICLEGSRTPPRTKPLESPQNMIATILRLEERLDDAESHHRVPAVDELIADDYAGITVGGGMITKRDVLAEVGGREEVSSESSDRETFAKALIRYGRNEVFSRVNPVRLLSELQSFAAAGDDPDAARPVVRGCDL